MLTHQTRRLYKSVGPMMNNVIRAQISDTLEDRFAYWLRRLDGFITPRKLQWKGTSKSKEISEFESLMGQTGVVQPETSYRATEGMTPHGRLSKRISEYQGAKEMKEEPEFKRKLKKIVQMPWESDAFDISVKTA